MQILLFCYLRQLFCCSLVLYRSHYDIMLDLYIVILHFFLFGVYRCYHYLWLYAFSQFFLPCPGFYASILHWHEFLYFSGANLTFLISIVIIYRHCSFSHTESVFSELISRRLFSSYHTVSYNVALVAYSSLL